MIDDSDWGDVWNAINDRERKLKPRQSPKGKISPKSQEVEFTVPGSNLTLGTSQMKTGRSDAGNLRNYKQMSEEKLEGVINDVVREDNDPEAMIALLKEVARRYT